MNVLELKKIISECMGEIKENYEQPIANINNQSDMRQPEEHLDKNIKVQNWGELINACVHDKHSRFLEDYFLPAMSNKRETIGAMLEALAESEDVQEEVFRAIEEFRKTRNG